MENGSKSESLIYPTQTLLTDPAETEPLWTVDEVALFMRLKAGTVRAMARRGELPSIKIGRGWRFERVRIQEMVRNNK